MPDVFTYERPAFSPVKRTAPAEPRRKVRARNDEAVYQKNRKVALAREKRLCQFCAKKGQQTHHVGDHKRCRTRGMDPEYRHDPDYLMVLCGNTPQDGCHGLCESSIVKVYGSAVDYTCERYDDKAQDWLPWVPPAKQRRKAA